MRQAVAERAAAAKPLGEHGGERKEEEQGNNVTLIRGNDGNYLTRRIARDRPDVLDRMKAGEFKSVRAAAIEAGISPMASWRTLASGSRSSTKPPTKRSRFAGRLKVGCASHN